MIGALFISLRPKQWLKNLIVYAGIVFSLRLFVLVDLVKVSYAFLLFCAVTSSIYLLNDLLDRESDQLHPKKKLRPLASGRLSPTVAIIAICLLAPLSLWLSFLLSVKLVLIVILYYLMMLCYVFGLKKMVIVDAFIIAAGYVLRGVAGIEVINIKMSPWFLVCASLLALFIVFCKRRHELMLLGEAADRHRASLQGYGVVFLDQLIAIVTAAVIVTYSLYTLAPETVLKFHTQKLILTVPFVLFGLFRFLYLVYNEDEGGSAETIMLTDWPLILTMLGWLVAVLVVLYGGKIIPLI